VDRKRKVLAYLAWRNSATGEELKDHLVLSRQALSIHLRSLIEAGKVVRVGTTRGARYMLTRRAPAAAVISRPLRTPGLDEDRVWDDLAARFNTRRVLRPRVEAIVRYAFTEMLNNAIEHSESDRCTIRFGLEAGAVSFEVRDPGIGVFHSIASKLHLPDEEAALAELLKGRTTTMHEAHTGEGIFFTSKAADQFVLRSHRIQVEWNQAKDDVFVSKLRFLLGTEVRFRVQRSTGRRLEKVFSGYAPKEYDFSVSENEGARQAVTAGLCLPLRGQETYGEP
jgi:anti-sigma regulatory factor (Ser/Thr protein kinase)/biotin operon repressor